MPKVKTFYQCQSCGYASPKWLGKCPDCGEWNTLVEERKETVPSRLSLPAQFRKAEPQFLSSIKAGYEQRTSTGIRELDRVLGGGVVTGSVVLVGGDPGIGKSTIQYCTILGRFLYNYYNIGTVLIIHFCISHQHPM